MALAFPSSPSTGQTYTSGSDTYVFDGKRWGKQVAPITAGADLSNVTEPMIVKSQNLGVKVIDDVERTGSWMLTNEDWSPYFRGDYSSNTVWDSAQRGMVCTNAREMYFNTIFPIDETSTYRLTVRFTVVSGNPRFYGGVDTLSVNKQTLRTDTSSSFNYGLMSNETLGPGTYTRSATFSGYNAISQGNSNRFDPTGAYFSPLLLINYQSTGSVTVVHSFTVERVAGTQDGSSPANAAPDAKTIKEVTGTTQDGLYWIEVPGHGVQQVYCDMNTDGGGWMHVGTISDNNENTSQVSSTAQQTGGVHPWGAPAFPSQDLGLWEDDTLLGSQSFTSDFKSAAWSKIPMTQILMKDNGGSLRNLFYTNAGQIASQTLSSWFGSLVWNANGSDTSSAAYAAGRVTGLNITNFGVVDPVLESGNKTVMLFKFGEKDGVQDGNKDRSVIARHPHNVAQGVDAPSGIGCFRSADPSQSGWYQRWRDIIPASSGYVDEPPLNISGAPYNYTVWVR